MVQALLWPEPRLTVWDCPRASPLTTSRHWSNCMGSESSRPANAERLLSPAHDPCFHLVHLGGGLPCVSISRTAPQCSAVLNEGVLDPKGPIAAAERQILFNSLGIMLAIVIPVILATLGVAFWFRASNQRARYHA